LAWRKQSGGRRMEEMGMTTRVVLPLRDMLKTNRITVVLVALISCVLFMGQSGDSDTIRAKRIELVDDSGRVRMVLRANDTPGMFIFDHIQPTDTVLSIAGGGSNDGEIVIGRNPFGEAFPHETMRKWSNQGLIISSNGAASSIRRVEHEDVYTIGDAVDARAVFQLGNMSGLKGLVVGKTHQEDYTWISQHGMSAHNEDGDMVQITPRDMRFERDEKKTYRVGP